MYAALFSMRRCQRSGAVRRCQRSGRSIAKPNTRLSCTMQGQTPFEKPAADEVRCYGKPNRLALHGHRTRRGKRSCSCWCVHVRASQSACNNLNPLATDDRWPNRRRYVRERVRESCAFCEPPAIQCSNRFLKSCQDRSRCGLVD